MIITIIAGARPNFIKIAPIIEVIEKKKKEGKKIVEFVNSKSQGREGLSGLCLT